MTASTNSIRDRFVALVQSKTGLDDQHAKDLEIGVFNWAVMASDKYKVVKNWKSHKFMLLYKDKARSVLANIDKTSYINNARLMDRLKEHEFLPHEVAFMQPENVFPEKWKELLDEKLKRDVVFEEKPEAMTTQFRCGKCKRNSCIYREKQVRSADEPMTLFITCLNCGNRWRM